MFASLKARNNLSEMQEVPREAPEYYHRHLMKEDLRGGKGGYQLNHCFVCCLEVRTVPFAFCVTPRWWVAL